MAIYTGQGFPKEKALAYAGVCVSALMLLIITLDYIENSKHRKVTKELAEEQLKAMKKQNGTA